MTHLTPSVLIHRATRADASRVASLLVQLGYAQSEQLVADRLAQQDGRTAVVWVAVVDDLVVGFLALQVLHFFHTIAPVSRITSMAVDAKTRRTGVGKALVDAAILHSKTLGCAVVEVTSSLHRDDAHAFYSRLGFHQDSRKYVFPL